MATNEMATRPVNVLLAGQECTEEELDFLIEEKTVEEEGDFLTLGMNAFCFE